MSEDTLKQTLTKQRLLAEAGKVYYSRGKLYFESRCVRNLEITEYSVSGTVTGTHSYKVSLSAVNGLLYSSCNCPLGCGGEFCKHKVALGLAYLEGDLPEEKEKNQSKFNWKKFVKTRSREELEKIIFEMSPHCSELIEKYRMENLPSEENDLIMELKYKIDQLAELAEDCGYYDDDYYDYEQDTDSNYDFQDGADLLRSAMDSLIDKDMYKQLFRVAEYGIEQIRKTSTYHEEPVADFLENMLHYYVLAASFNVAEPEYIAAQIYSWEDANSYCGFGNLDSLFGDLPLSVKELWYEQALAEWRKFPSLKMGDSDRDYRRKRIERRLIFIASEKKDDKFKRDIMENNLSEPSTVIALTEEYRKNKMQNKILPLLQKAKNKFPNNIEIRNALVKEQQKLGKTEDALKIAWNDFEEHPLREETFSFLQKVSGEAKCGNLYFEKALDFLAELEVKNKSYYPSYYNPVRERRVEILLDAKKYDTAWELGKDANITERMMLRLLRWRAKEKPEEAAAVCNVLVNKALEPVGERAYEHVISLLKIYREYMLAAKKESQFTQYCQWIKTEYWRRKNLIKLLNKNHL